MKVPISLFFLAGLLQACNGNGKHAKNADETKLHDTLKPEQYAGSGNSSVLKFTQLKDSIAISFGDSQFVVEGRSVMSVIDKSGKDTERPFDFDKDGAPEIAVMADDPFGSKGDLTIYKPLNGRLEKLKFYTKGDEYDGLIAFENLAFADAEGNIYVYGLPQIDEKNNQRLMEIDKYKWSAEKKGFVYLKNKVFPPMTDNEPMSDFIF